MSTSWAKRQLGVFARAPRTIGTDLSSSASSILPAFDEMYNASCMHIDLLKEKTSQQLNELMMPDGLLGMLEGNDNAFWKRNFFLSLRLECK